MTGQKRAADRQKEADKPRPRAGAAPLVNSPVWLESPIDAVRHDGVARNRFVLVRRLIQVSRRWRQFLSMALQDTAGQRAGWQTLFWLSLSGSTANQRELAQRIGVRESTIVRALDALEKQGLVERKAASGDRRAKAVVLTDEAEPVIAEINSKAQTLRDRLLADIDADDLAITVRVLDQIAARMDVFDEELAQG